MEKAQSGFSYAYWRTDKPKEEGFSHELISTDSAKILDKTDLDTLEALPYEGIDTVLKGFKRNAERIPNNDMLGTRVGDTYEWQTWGEVNDKALHISYGMVHFDLIPDIEAEDTTYRFVGIQSKNRAEWEIAHLANMYQSVTTVAFFDTLGPDAQKYIINQTELTTMVVSIEYVGKLAKTTKADRDTDGKLKTLKNIVVLENDVPAEDRSLCEEAGLQVFTLEQLYQKGKEIAKESTTREPTSDQCSAFSYTSGTTGDPKGVKLTHKMLVQAQYAVWVRAQQKELNKFTDAIDETDTYISYLPAAHSFEQCVMAMHLITGMKAGFYAGNTLKLTEDIGILRPTLFPSVPRLYNKIYGKIKDGLAAKKGVVSWLATKAVNAKLYNLKNGGGVHHGFYDKVIFKKMKAILGGRVKLMITGSAPIAGDVLDFLKICFSSPICEGYGMTETCAGSVITFQNDPQTGIVGGPLQNVKLRLRDIPEMNYFSQGTQEDPTPKGEVMFWGPSIMQGYFKNPEKTAESFHDGWLLSGDVGLVYPNGALKIIDRAKNIFKLSQGEYIAPEKLENVYVKSSWVAQVWIHGDSL